MNPTAKTESHNWNGNSGTFDDGVVLCDVACCAVELVVKVRDGPADIIETVFGSWLATKTSLFVEPKSSLSGQRPTFNAS